MKTYVVYDNSYDVRENIGYWRGTFSALKKKLFQMLKAREFNVEDAKYTLDNYMEINEIGNLINEQIDSQYAEGLNWLGNLKTVSVPAIKKGHQDRMKTLNKYGYKGGKNESKRINI